MLFPQILHSQPVAHSARNPPSRFRSFLMTTEQEVKKESENKYKKNRKKGAYDNESDIPIPIISRVHFRRRFPRLCLLFLRY